MTAEQKATIEKLFAAYSDNIKEYAAWSPQDSCSFSTYYNEANNEDKHIVCVWVRVSGLNEIEIPQTEVINLLIEPSGSYYDMDVLTGVFETRSQMVEYISKLKKFDWRGK